MCKRSPKEAQTNPPEYSVTKSIFASHIYTLSHQILRIDGSKQFAVSVVYVFLILLICLLVHTSNSYSIHVVHRFVYAVVAFMVCSFCVSSIKKKPCTDILDAVAAVVVIMVVSDASLLLLHDNKCKPWWWMKKERT